MTYIMFYGVVRLDRRCATAIDQINTFKLMKCMECLQIYSRKIKIQPNVKVMPSGELKEKSHLNRFNCKNI